MRLLLDTHLVLWLLAEPERVSPETRTRIARSTACVSVASLWEIAIKHGLGKLDAAPARVLERLEAGGAVVLPITAAHAIRAGELPRLHGDPFDRMLVAQALVEPLRLVTTDAALAAHGSAVEVVA